MRTVTTVRRGRLCLARSSYGLYLWHWPVFALTRPEFDLASSGAPLLGLRLALTFVSAELCYRFVELPIRAGALARLRTRPWLLGVSGASLAALSLALVSVSGARLADARVPSDNGAALVSRPAAPSAFNDAPAVRELPGRALATRAKAGVPLDPAWPKTLTLLSDSVGLGLSRALPAALPEWKVEVIGRPALMVKQVVPEFLNARAVGSVVVIALAYNSLFERDRKNYARWSGIWDRSAERLLSDLKACGAKKLIWISLREPSAEFVTEAGRDQYERYAWFFPYVNERIRALAERHPELTIADWQAVSNPPDLTKDLIHLSPSGVSLLTETVVAAVLGAPLAGTCYAMSMQRLAVIGAGIAGLTVALRRVGLGDQVSLFEASTRVGGQLSSETVDGFVVEHGAEGFVARSEAVPRLAAEAGIAGQIVEQLEQRSFRFDGHRLVELLPGEAGRLLGFQVPPDDLGRGVRSFAHGMAELPERVALTLGAQIELHCSARSRASRRVPAA